MKRFIKSYCKEVKFDNGGSIISLAINYNDFSELKPNEKGFVRLVLAKKREKDEYGNTHYLYLDEYVPKKDLPF